jgi:hypothetical protein
VTAGWLPFVRELRRMDRALTKRVPRGRTGMTRQLGWEGERGTTATDGPPQGEVTVMSPAFLMCYGLQNSVLRRAAAQGCCAVQSDKRVKFSP